MNARIIDGKAIATIKKQLIKDKIASENLTPSVAIILANDLDASKIYVRRKMKICDEMRITANLHELFPNTSTKTIIDLIHTLNGDRSVHGIFVQLPLPDHHDTNAIIQSIDPRKDVDGLTAVNLGKIISDDQTGLSPCTPQGVMDMLAHENIDLHGKHAVIIGRSLLFGKPMGQMLLNANCTVTQCHSKTVDLPNITKQADILIAAVGHPNMVKSDWVKDGAVVIDVGINKGDDGKIIGDVDFDAVQKVASHITPVPGGVGPMTVISLMANVVRACTNIDI